MMPVVGYKLGNSTPKVDTPEIKTTEEKIEL
jgi:hypothetical protein